MPSRQEQETAPWLAPGKAAVGLPEIYRRPAEEQPRRSKLPVMTIETGARVIGTRMLPVVAALLLFATASAAEAKRPRPDAVAGAQTVVAPNDFQLYNEYASPESTYASKRVVVHYVVLGIDAPPLNDDDHDGVPDYVERVGEAADRSLSYYERRGFRTPLEDAGGPDSRPDLYISRFAPGTFGVALPAVNADGGAFAVIANNLDPSAGRSLASVYGTVAHELFHLVQFSYFGRSAEPDIPTWILEGSASGIEARVYPDLNDLVSSIQMRRWLSATQVSLTQQSYGAQLLWFDLDREQPRFLPTLLRRLAAHPARGEGVEAVRSTFADVARAPFAPAFERFAVSAAADYDAAIEPLFAVLPGRTRAATVAPLAVHYLRAVLPRDGRYALVVRFPHGHGSARATLTYELENDTPGQPSLFRRIEGRSSDHGRTLTFLVPRALRADVGLASPRLVVSNGGGRAVAYAVSAR